MELVKKTDKGTIYKKSNGRYGVKNAQKKWINGEEKTNVLLAEGLITVAAPKAKEEPATEEAAPAEETQE